MGARVSGSLEAPPVRVRTSRWRSALSLPICIGLAAMGGYLVLLGNREPWILGGFAAFSLAAVYAAFQVFGPSGLEITPQKVSAKSPLGSKSVAWEQVTACQVFDLPYGVKAIQFLLAAPAGAKPPVKTLTGRWAMSGPQLEGLLKDARDRWGFPLKPPAPKVVRGDADLSPAARELAVNLIGRLNAEYSRAEGGGRTLPDVHAVLNALGALAGVTCQVVARSVEGGQGVGVHEIATADGRRYYIGDGINRELLGEGGVTGLWQWVAGAVEEPELARRIDLDELAGHTVRTMGTPEFGVPRWPDGRVPAELPLDAARRHWPLMRGLLAAAPAHERLHVAALAAARVVRIACGRDPQAGTLAPLPAETAVRIVMEAAAPMSKIDAVALNAGTL